MTISPVRSTKKHNDIICLHLLAATAVDYTQRPQREIMKGFCNEHNLDFGTKKKTEDFTHISPDRRPENERIFTTK
jgi:hypothetical protein